jgi:hypothetical protein
MTTTIPALLKADLAAVCEQRFAETRDPDYRRAYLSLRGKYKVGRKRVDDPGADDEIKLLVSYGFAVETAARQVAATLTVDKPTYTEQTARRLARKFRAAQNNLSAAQNILSVDPDSNVA